MQDPGGDALAHVTARHGALRRPPAIVRWGLLVWMAGCFYAAATKYPVADGRVKALAHLYYQAPAITLTAIWLWGANLWVWSRMRLDPHPLTVFELEDSRVHLGHRQVWTLCGWCTAAYAANLAKFLHFANEGEEFIAAAAPVLLYVATPIVILAPHGGWHARTRRFFATTVRRALSRVVVPSPSPTSSSPTWRAAWRNRSATWNARCARWWRGGDGSVGRGLRGS